MDFIEGLPKVHDKSVILIVVDRFSMYAHFIALSHPYTTTSVARAFFEGVVHLHGFPASIITLSSRVWRYLFKMAGITLHMSMAFQPQKDGLRW
jgi:hypothetical protein